MTALVIVESPAKAKTIGRFLGKDYVVEASYGHIRDLPNKAEQIPEKYKKQKWARLGVNVEEDFAPLYVVPDDKKKHVQHSAPTGPHSKARSTRTRSNGRRATPSSATPRTSPPKCSSGWPVGSPPNRSAPSTPGSRPTSPASSRGSCTPSGDRA